METDALIDQSGANEYWTSIPSTVDGMLGGFPQVSRVDLLTSRAFITKLLRSSPPKHSSNSPSNSPSSSSPSDPSDPSSPFPLENIVDCGAGIGRITLGLLQHLGRNLTIVEPISKFTEELGRNGEFKGLVERGRVRAVYNVPLQDWDPTRPSSFPSSSSSSSSSSASSGSGSGSGLDSTSSPPIPPVNSQNAKADPATVPTAPKYDLIWNQWCLGHLTTPQLTAYLRRCKQALADGGWIIVKENLSTDSSGLDIFDEVDKSVTRTEERWGKVFEEAGLKVVRSEVQRGMPRELLPVRMWALR